MIVAKTALAALLLALLPAPPAAHANPHVWVEARMAFELQEHRVKGLTFVWRFDDYYSSHTIRSHDRDRDGVFTPAEMRALRAGTFDPLGRSDYHVHVWTEGGKREGHAIDRFTAKIEDMRLVIEFFVPLTPPADPGEAPVIVSLFDRKNVVDFSFPPSGFLGVRGELKPDCKFRIKRGKGEQAGHPRPVTLRCGG